MAFLVTDVEAEFTLLPTSQSGRSTGITSGYRPNHNFGGPSDFNLRMGQVEVPGGGWIQPGETRTVRIRFIIAQEHTIPFAPGLAWRIQEATRHVGNGKVVRVLHSELAPD